MSVGEDDGIDVAEGVATGEESHRTVHPVIAEVRGSINDELVFGIDLGIGPDINHGTGAIGVANKVVRNVPSLGEWLRKLDLEGLGGNARDAGVKVQAYQVVAFQPGLETDMPVGGGTPPEVGEISLSLVRRQRGESVANSRSRLPSNPPKDQCSRQRKIAP